MDELRERDLADALSGDKVLMMGANPERCFCHLNGYKVKDATARKTLEGGLSMGDIKVSSVLCKNLFDEDRWFKELSKVSDTAISKEVVDGVEYIKFMPYGICEYQYMLGEFKENTQYTISALARKYDNTELVSTGFYFVYTDGTQSFKFVNNTLEEYLLTLTSDPGKTISYIRLGYAYDNHVLMRNIQLEEGNIGTDYVKHFEIATKGDASTGRIEGYYQKDIPIRDVLWGQDTNFENLVTNEDTINGFKELIEEVIKDDIKNPIIMINNSLDSYVDEESGNTVELPSPRKLTLTHLHSFVSDDGFTYYGLDGHADYIHGSTDVDEDIETVNLEEFSVLISGSWEGASYTVNDLKFYASNRRLVSKKYLTDKLESVGGSEGFYFAHTDEALIDPSSTSQKTITNTNVINAVSGAIFKHFYDDNGVHQESGFRENFAFYLSCNPSNRGHVASGCLFDRIKVTNKGQWYTLYGHIINGLELIEVTMDIQGSWSSDGTYKNTSLKIKCSRIETPTQTYHLATKSYVDAQIQALRTELSGTTE
jgi:hypothetical protein